MIRDYGWQLRAYVLMSNHYHLYVRTPQANLSMGMRDLNGQHASFFNRRHKRVGHLFGGRFKSHLVNSETYLLALARYIVLNPVRAGMVNTAGEWRWSSYRATAGLAVMPAWLDPGPILDAINADDWNKAVRGYREFVEGVRSSEVEVTEGEWRKDPTPTPITSTSDDLTPIRTALESMGIIEEWPPRAGSTARCLVATMASRHTDAGRAAIGRFLGITARGVLYLIRLGEERAERDQWFAELILEGQRHIGLEAEK